jgi:hypothetical protein
MVTPIEDDPWPELPLASWRPTRDALHLWTQMVGKTLLATRPPLNHWWHAALRVSARGLASAPAVDGDRLFVVELDLVEHLLTVRTSDGRMAALPLGPGSIRGFYREYMDLLAGLGIAVHLRTTPVELPDAVPFEQDAEPRPYDAAAAHRFFEVLRRCDAVLKDLGTGFVGKQSPVHFFWGSFDLAATRFSGRRAPERPGADPITREAYSHEVISFGFWPGGRLPTGASVDEPIFYAYQAPEPVGLREATVLPPEARYDAGLGEFVLPYARALATGAPGAALRAFCESVYDAGADLAGWDRSALERTPLPPPAPALPFAGASPSPAP